MKFGKRVSTFFNTTGDIDYECVMHPALQSGDIDAVRRFIRERENLYLFSVDVEQAVQDIFSDPTGYKNSAASLNLLFNHHVATGPIFSALEKEKTIPLETDLWIAYATNPSDDAAEGLGIIMAEYIKYRMGTDTAGYQLDLNKLLPQEDDDISVKIRGDILNSIKTVQHQLVEYVASEGGELPLNRAAGLLSVGSDLPGAELWTKKIEGYSVRTRESLIQGTIRQYSPVFSS